MTRERSHAGKSRKRHRRGGRDGTRSRVSRSLLSSLCLMCFLLIPLVLFIFFSVVGFNDAARPCTASLKTRISSDGAREIDDALVVDRGGEKREMRIKKIHRENKREIKRNDRQACERLCETIVHPSTRLRDSRPSGSFVMYTDGTSSSARRALVVVETIDARANRAHRL